jgi:fumarate reductase subunit D
MKKYLAPLVAVALTLPLLAGAATITSVSDAGTTIINIINNVLVPVLFAVAFIVFIWGAFNVFILGANDEEAKTRGKNLMLYGLIGFFVMVSVWGLVNILVGTFSTNNALPTLPKANF